MYLIKDIRFLFFLYETDTYYKFDVIVSFTKKYNYKYIQYIYIRIRLIHLCRTISGFKDTGHFLQSGRKIIITIAWSLGQRCAGSAHQLCVKSVAKQCLLGSNFFTFAAPKVSSSVRLSCIHESEYTFILMNQSNITHGYIKITASK